jgi:hypothetical protein
VLTPTSLSLATPAQLTRLNALQSNASTRGAVREADALSQAKAIALDALRRAQAVERMIRYSMPECNRIPTEMRVEASTGQLMQPPQIAAAFDPTTGVFHAFAIYELRSASEESRAAAAAAAAAAAVDSATADSAATDSAAAEATADSAAADSAIADSAESVADSASGSDEDAPPREGDAISVMSDTRSVGQVEWHVYISELLNMRHLVPGQTCWRPKVAGLLVNLLQRQVQGDQPVVVLRGVNDSKPGSGGQGLDNHYARIGFTSDRSPFSEAGLLDVYPTGSLILR